MCGWLRTEHTLSIFLCRTICDTDYEVLVLLMFRAGTPLCLGLLSVVDSPKDIRPSAPMRGNERTSLGRRGDTSVHAQIVTHSLDIH